MKKLLSFLLLLTGVVVSLRCSQDYEIKVLNVPAISIALNPFLPELVEAIGYKGRTFRTSTKLDKIISK